MIVYRIAKEKYIDTDIDGIGASLQPGQWNLEGINCVYAAESRALALIEHMVNISKEQLLHSKLILRTIEIPDRLIQHIPVRQLPANWREVPPPDQTKIFGTVLLKNKQYLGYVLPSVIIEQEFNIIINPLHRERFRMKVSDKPFNYDSRLMEKQ